MTGQSGTYEGCKPTLLYPLPADSLMARSPSHKSEITGLQHDLQGFMQEANVAGVPADLAAYVRLVDQLLRHWQQQVAVAIKFYDVYFRTLRIADVAEERATPAAVSVGWRWFRQLSPPRR